MSQTMEQTSEYVKTAEAARIAAVHDQTVRRWIKEGKLPATKTITGQLRVKHSDVLKILSRAS